MKFYQTHPTLSDETAPYHVTDYEATNAADFVSEVLTENPNEWGYIRVEGFGEIEYQDGKVLGKIPEKWKQIPIGDVNSSGGWSRMDYKVSIKISPEYYKLYQK